MKHNRFGIIGDDDFMVAGDLDKALQFIQERNQRERQEDSSDEDEEAEPVIESLEDLANFGSDSVVQIIHMIYDHEIPHAEAAMMIGEYSKFFAAEYHRLITEGKIKPNEQYKRKEQ
jgi:predicted transcriptional regulator